MEGVSTVMPLALKTGMGALDAALSSGGGGENAAEVRARNIEAGARRQAEAVEREARKAVRQGRESSQHAVASAHVAAADSGLELSGTSLLNLTSLERAGDEDLSRVMGEAALRVQSLLDAGAEQARSVRLSARQSSSRNGGLGSLLRLGGQGAGNGGIPGGIGGGTPGTIPTLPASIFFLD